MSNNTIETLTILRNNKVEKVTGDIKSLIKHLEHELNLIENQQGYLFNSCGIVQDRGISIDRLCTEISIYDNNISIVDGSSPLL